MAWRFNPPPGWPAPPQGWTPPNGWTPDPSWPPAPDGWQFWVQEAEPPPTAAPQRSRAGVVVAVVALVVLGVVAVAAVAVFALGRGLGGLDLGIETKNLQTPTEASAVRIDNDCGPISVREGSGGVVSTQARITTVWRTPTVTSRDEGDRAVVQVRCPSFSGGVQLSVAVPPGADVEARSAAGSVTADGLSGEVNLHSSAGSVRGDDLQSDQAEAQSSAGSVSLTWAEDADPQRVDASSSAGSVTVLLADRRGTAYAVDADSSAGSTRVEVRTDPESSRTVRAQSSAGSVTVAYR
jgi:hypothetical protein